MIDARVNYAVVGGFVLLMLVAMVAVVAVLTGRTGSTDTYFTVLPNVTGVKYGTRVTYEGFTIGQVEEIHPMREAGQTRFRVVMSVQQGWQIPKDSVARVAAAGILAAVAVDIKGGGSPEMLPPGSDIAGGPTANIFAVMNDVAGQVADLNQNALKPLLGTLNQRVEALSGILEKQAPELMANLVALTSDLAQKTPRITGEVERMTATLSQQVVTPANARRIEETLANAAELSKGLQDSRRKVDSALTTLDRMMAANRENVDQSMKDLRYTLRSLAGSIDSVTYNLESTSRNMNEFSRQLRDNPGLLLGGRRGEDERR